mmetsp:Transcript_13409/g.30885  ORF Transcript_13409/g.30885 Transcript_13409/m.30885 type:complete len:82 (+) Transcript_13409:287-532(+)
MSKQTETSPGKRRNILGLPTFAQIEYDKQKFTKPVAPIQKMKFRVGSPMSSPSNLGNAQKLLPRLQLLQQQSVHVANLNSQ